MTWAGVTPVECGDITVQEAGVGEGRAKRVSLKTEVTCLVLGPPRAGEQDSCPLGRWSCGRAHKHTPGIRVLGLIMADLWIS